jgi:hypothetical protein
VNIFFPQPETLHTHPHPHPHIYRLLGNYGSDLLTHGTAFEIQENVTSYELETAATGKNLSKSRRYLIDDGKTFEKNQTKL